MPSYFFYSFGEEGDLHKASSTCMTTNFQAFVLLGLGLIGPKNSRPYSRFPLQTFFALCPAAFLQKPSILKLIIADDHGSGKKMGSEYGGGGG